MAEAPIRPFFPGDDFHYHNASTDAGKTAQLAERTDVVRTALLVGSRARSGGAGVDDLSDWDVLLFLTDPEELTREDAWLGTFGDVLLCLPGTVRQLDRVVPTRLVSYVEGHRIDFTVSSTEVLRVLSLLPELPPWLDAGYRVLVDKGGLSATMVPPSGRGYAGRVPDVEDVLGEIREFLWEALVAGKQLARGEPLSAAHAIEGVMRQGLHLRMLEYLAQVRGGWSGSVGPVGRGVHRVLGPVEWAGALPTGRSEPEWAGLEQLLDAYRTAAREVVASLGGAYPSDLDDRVRNRLKALKAH